MKHATIPRFRFVSFALLMNLSRTGTLAISISMLAIGTIVASIVLTSIVVVPRTEAAPLPDIKSEAAAVDEHYNHLRSLQAEFTQLYQGSGIERAESGTIWLKKPGKMRWEYRSPREKLFVSDGKDTWFYVPGDRQARKTPVGQLDDLRSPIAFLLGKTKLEKELDGLSFAPDVTPLNAGDVVLRGVPRMLADRISEIVLEVTPEHQIARIVIDDVEGSSTEYRFTGQKEDVQVADKQFQFHPPPGTETVDGLEP